MTSATETLIEEQFQVGSGADLAVHNFAGRVTVRAGDEPEIRMRAFKHGRQSAIEQTRIETSQDGDRITIRTVHDDTGSLRFNRSVGSVDYDISVPRGCRVSVKVVSANVAVSGTGAEVNVESVSGDLEIETTQNCSVSTVSGDLKARSVDGVLTLRTTSGDATIRVSSIRSLNYHSVSGDLTIETPLTAGEHYFGKTVSGDLTFIVPPTSGATIQMKSVSGDVVSELPAQIIRSGRRHWQGNINGGGAAVELNSVSGDLRIVAGQRGDDDAAPQRTDRDEAVSDVLHALEKGEMSVEDAMTRMRALRS